MKNQKPLLALDIGGANLKAADGCGFARSRPFPLWRKPERLADEIGQLLAESPATERLAVTMTGELADCFATKAEGVAAIVAAVVRAARGRPVEIYLTDGKLAAPDEALEQPLKAAASNWHALAAFACRYVDGAEEPGGGLAGLLLDIGSTTCDIIPLVNGRPAASGATDPERLLHGELVYTGVERSPICALAATIPWRGESCAVAQEVFATTCDVYLTLGELPEMPDSALTADGRPATRAAARDRLARMICADRTMFDESDALAAAKAITEAQQSQVVSAARRVIARMPALPAVVIVSGSGEFLARRVVRRLDLPASTLVSLNDLLGPAISRCAPAHALAVLARESH